MKGMFNVRLSRRQFLRASAVAAGAAALSGSGGWVSNAFADAETRAVTQTGTTADQAYENVWIPTTCLSCAPHVKCSHLVHRVNGVAVRVKGTRRRPSIRGR